MAWKNRSTLVRSASDWRARSPAAPSTAAAPVPVLLSPSVTPVILAYFFTGSVGTTDAASTFSPDTSNLSAIYCEILTRDDSGAAAEDGTASR
jgi:hypothetical protein